MTTLTWQTGQRADLEPQPALQSVTESGERDYRERHARQDVDEEIHASLSAGKGRWARRPAAGCDIGSVV